MKGTDIKGNSPVVDAIAMLQLRHARIICLQGRLHRDKKRRNVGATRVLGVRLGVKFGVRQLAAASSFPNLLGVTLGVSHSLGGRATGESVGIPSTAGAGNKAAASCRTPN